MDAENSAADAAAGIASSAPSVAAAAAAAPVPAPAAASDSEAKKNPAEDVAAAAARAIAEAQRRKTGGFVGYNAGAPEFVPAAVRVDPAAKLPPSHRMMLRGCFQDPATCEWGNYNVGFLKSYSSHNGYGFIECEESHKDWGCDIFVHKNCVPMPWHLGQPVEFRVLVNTRGQPQATDVNWLPRLPEKPRPKAVVAPAPEVVASVAKAATPQTEAPQEQPNEPRKLGTLKSFSPAQGYGFIACEEVFANYQRDVYFDKSQLPSGSWRFGQTVEFSVAFNARKHPQARGINWDPVPSLNGSIADASSEAGVKSHSPQSLLKLSRLAKLLHQRQTETAIVVAIDCQGGENGPPGENVGESTGTELDVDFVSFVLDRMPKASEAVSQIKDFVKMLLLLMLSKMLRKQTNAERSSQFVDWFEALTTSIDPSVEGVREHLKDVMMQVQKHLEAAARERPRTNAGEQEAELAARLEVAMRQLQSAFEPEQTSISRPPGLE